MERQETETEVRSGRELVSVGIKQLHLRKSLIIIIVPLHA